MVIVKHSPFSFDEKVDFVNYCQRALYLTTTRVLKPLLHVQVLIYIKKKKRFDNFFKKF